MGRLFAWLAGGRPRLVWTSILWMTLWILAAPYTAALWRIMLYGDALDQAVVVSLLGMLWMLVRLRRRWHDAGCGGMEGKEHDDEAEE